MSVRPSAWERMTEIDKQVDKQLRDNMNEDWVVCEHKKPESGDRRHCALTRGRRRERGTAAGAGLGVAVVSLQRREHLS